MSVAIVGVTSQPTSIVPQSTSIVHVARCQARTKSGIPCKWTSCSDDPVAAPLKIGQDFCFWHAPRRKKQDANQQKLEKFFVSRGNCASPLRSRDQNSDPLPIQNEHGSCDKPKATLTPEQLAQIAENRQKALDRREQRMKEVARTQPTTASQEQWASQDDFDIAPTQPMLQSPGQETQISLSQEQVDRIAQNRSEALERRRKRQEALAKTIAPVLETSSVSISCDKSTIGAVAETPRSRTPEARRRRPLLAQMTASPPPLPVQLQRHQQVVGQVAHCLPK